MEAASASVAASAPVVTVTVAAMSEAANLLARVRVACVFINSPPDERNIGDALHSKQDLIACG